MKKGRAVKGDKALEDFLTGKSDHTVSLFKAFITEFQKVGRVTVHPAKTMIGIATPRRRIAYVTQLGKNFVHVIFPFKQPYTGNDCFQKIAQVPGDVKQFNHHFRMYDKEDLNSEILSFMELAYRLGTEDK
ncbi:DUF5655 domain-containing protein [Chryseosolibacter indicus]|uniref:DUF5655 domain-containing protein n=1 Tax=Chryseosolibacter indicus TaxID=2782351 RepID=A0ABS5VSE0_9BACT|nr:DUF5655 domain-containing protein [Chryseosolibacter indicus]MBT1703784.1 hypothetical protein [Chryseosolibacter indicus]